MPLCFGGRRLDGSTALEHGAVHSHFFGQSSFASHAVVATWQIPGGGSPDMGSVSPDGTQFWVTGRYHAEIYVIDTTTGALLKRLRTGAGPHGLTYFPQPGRYSLGHTGNYR